MSSATAATYALLHALWLGTAIAVVAALAMRARTAATRHAIAMFALAAMAVAPLATFAMYRAPSPAAVTTSGPVLVRGAGWLTLVLPIAWAIGAAVCALRQLVGWRAVLAASASRGAPGEWMMRVDRLRRRLGVKRRVAVRWQAHGAPWTARARRPIVWFPSAWAALPPAQRDALAMHELAHIRRVDWLWNGVQRALEGVLWFHPAAWALGRRAREEREHACDDCVIARGGDRIALAEALVAMARTARAPRLALAARGGELLVRVARLVGAPTPASRPVRPVLGMVIASMIGAVVATRVALPRDVLLELRVDASTAGALTPGTYREIDAAALRTRHHYRAAMDARGEVREVYEQDGQPRPIDASVRAWLDELIAIDAR